MDLRRDLPRADDPPARRATGPRSPSTTGCRAAAGELTVHLHGGHNRTQFDGQPGGLTASHPRSFYCQIPRGLSPRESGNDLLIEPGGRKTYVYDLREDGRPERAAFQWYHDHRLDHTARNIWRGLAGMWIVDDELDASLPLPAGERDIPLMIADRSFDRHNQLTDPFTGRRPPGDGVLGARVLVNGAYMPHHRVTPQRYRLRILNFSHFRSYNVHLSNGAPLVQIATDSGLMPKPVRRHERPARARRAGRGGRRLRRRRRRGGGAAQRRRGTAAATGRGRGPTPAR